MKTVKILLFILIASYTNNIAAQKYFIKYPNGNIIYTDSTNLIEIKINGIDSTRIVVYMDDEKLERDNSDHNYYLYTGRKYIDKKYINAKKVGDSIKVKIGYKKQWREKIVHKQIFYIRRINPFLARMGTFESGDWISAEEFEKLDSISIINFSTSEPDRNKKFKVIKYSVWYLPKRASGSDEIEIKGSLITDKIKKMVMRAKSGDRVWLYKIFIKSESGEIKEVYPLAFSFKNN